MAREISCINATPVWWQQEGVWFKRCTMYLKSSMLAASHMQKWSFKLALFRWSFCTTCTLFSLMGRHVPSSTLSEWASHHFLQQHAEKPPPNSSCLLFSISLSSLLPRIRWQMLMCGFHVVLKIYVAQQPG